MFAPVEQPNVVPATSDTPEAQLISPVPTNLVEGIQETFASGQTASIRGPGLDNQHYSALSQVEEPGGLYIMARPRPRTPCRH